ncbi:MAG: hypothetical protein K6G68_08650 [Oscillospiraceae bacterium]|nr:hypothetical protein [Oscillospiraceae bacterium]
MRKNIISFFLLFLFCGILFVGCSSGASGKVKDGVYSSSLFKVTTPSVGNFRCLTEEQMEKQQNYTVLFLNSHARGAAKTFKCEYAAVNGATDIFVASEDNVNGYTLDQFASAIEKGSDNAVLDNMKVTENKDITLNGISFRHIVVSLNDINDTAEYFIKQSGKRFVYIFIEYPNDPKEYESLGGGSREDAVNAISAP